MPAVRWTLPTKVLMPCWLASLLGCGRRLVLATDMWEEAVNCIPLFSLIEGRTESNH